MLGMSALTATLLVSCALYADILLDDRVINSRTVDLGDAPRGEAILQEFSICNTTGRPITVTKIFKSCHCQYLELNTGDTIAATETLTFTFGMPAPEPGVQFARAVITTDSEDDLLGKMVFTLRANVKSPPHSPHLSPIAAADSSQN